jgi:hypothetical protein
MNDYAYLVFTDDDKEKNHELNDKAYQLMILTIWDCEFS